MENGKVYEKKTKLVKDWTFYLKKKVSNVAFLKCFPRCYGQISLSSIKRTECKTIVTLKVSTWKRPHLYPKMWNDWPATSSWHSVFEQLQSVKTFGLTYIREVLKSRQLQGRENNKEPKVSIQPHKIVPWIDRGGTDSIRLSSHSCSCPFLNHGSVLA